MRDNDEIQMSNAELMTNPEGCGVICLERRGAGCAKVERVVLNALEKIAVLPPGIRALGGQTAIVFREADQPWARWPCRRTRAEATTFIRHCFSLRHLVIPSSLGIRALSFFRCMFVSRHDIGTQKKIVDVSHSE